MPRPKLNDEINAPRVAIRTSPPTVRSGVGPTAHGVRGAGPARKPVLEFGSRRGMARCSGRGRGEWHRSRADGRQPQEGLRLPRCSPSVLTLELSGTRHAGTLMRREGPAWRPLQRPVRPAREATPMPHFPRSVQFLHRAPDPDRHPDDPAECIGEDRGVRGPEACDRVRLDGSGSGSGVSTPTAVGGSRRGGWRAPEGSGIGRNSRIVPSWREGAARRGQRADRRPNRLLGHALHVPSTQMRRC